MPPVLVQRKASVPLADSETPTTTVPLLETALASLLVVPPGKSPRPVKLEVAGHVPHVPPQSTPVSFGASRTPFVQVGLMHMSIPAPKPKRTPAFWEQIRPAWQSAFVLQSPSPEGQRQFVVQWPALPFALGGQTGGAQTVPQLPPQSICVSPCAASSFLL